MINEKQNFKYTTVFSSILKPIVSEEKNKYLAKASLEQLKQFIPEIDVNRNFDLLPFASNAYVANYSNLNDDVVSGADAIKSGPFFINKFVDVEHNRNRIIGVLLACSYSEFGTDKSFKNDEVKDKKEPFNITVGGVIWRAVNDSLNDLIEESNDPSSPNYLKISASFEIGFNDYSIVLGKNNSRNLEDGEIITDSEKITKLSQFLKANGGSGKLEDGTHIYRLLKGQILPMGIALTQSPAAAVKGVAINTDEKDDKKANKDAKSFDLISNKGEIGMDDPNRATEKLIININTNNKKNDDSISQIKNDNVKHNNNTKIMKLKSITELNDENLKECNASTVRELFQEGIKEANEKYLSMKGEREKTEKELSDKNTALSSDLETLKVNARTIGDELKTLKDQVLAKQNEDKFNQRMASLDEEFDLSDEGRKAIAKKINGLKDEDYNDFYGILSATAKKKIKAGKNDKQAAIDEKNQGSSSKKAANKGEKPGDKADDNEPDGDEDDNEDTSKSKRNKNAKTAKSSVNDNNAESVLNDAIDNGDKSKQEIANGTTTEKPTLREKYAKAFGLDQFDIRLK